MATGDPLPRLAGALLEVSVRVQEISAELRALDLEVPQAKSPAEPTPAPAPTPPQAATPPPAWPGPMPPPQPVLPPTPQPVPAGPAPWTQLSPPTQAPSGLWERAARDGAGSRILAWAGGLVTLAGVVLLLVLAVQQGYLGPAPRVLLGVVLGLTLTGIGMWLHRNPSSRTGAYALAATGFAVLYLDVIAATAQFGFLPADGGLGAGLAVAGLGLLLAVRWRTQALAVFVVVAGACAAPLLTGGFVPLLLGFLLVLEIAATPAQLARRWGGLCLAAGIPPVLATLAAVATLAETDPADGPLIAYLGLVAAAAQVLVATVTGLVRPADSLPAGLLLLAPAPTLFAAFLLPKAGAIALPAAVGALLVAVWVVGRVTDVTLPPRFAAAAGAAGSVAVLQATITAFDGPRIPIALLAEALLIALVARSMRYPAALLAATVFGVIGLGAALLTAVPGTLVAVPPAGRVPASVTVPAGLTGVLLAAAAFAICWVATRERVLGEEGAILAWLAGGLVTLYGVTATILSVGLLVSPDRSGFLLGHVLVTVSWTAAALVALLRGIGSVPLRVAGLTLTCAALAKLVLFDLSSLDGLARVAVFLVAGLLLLGAGSRYARLLADRAPEVTEGR
jgi:uncharacterized membrane protein